MEATGVYYECCALFLFKAGLHVSVVLPNKAKKYLQATGLKTKNDKIDAKGLARMAAEQSLDKWQPMSEFFFALRGMTRQLQNLQEMKTSISNQLHAAELSMFPIKGVTKQLKDLLKKIEKQIKAMQLVIEKHIQSNQEVAIKAAKMSSIKGVGVTTIAVILGETNGFALFENVGQLISYTGYDVVENQSGIRIGKTRISKKGNHRIRRILHLPAFSVVKHQVPPFVNLFNRTYEKHKIKMKSYVAVQKKLLVILYTLWKKDEVFSVVKCADVEVVPTSRLDIEEVFKKSSPEQVEATQGQYAHLVSAYAASRLS
jgi:transposase